MLGEERLQRARDGVAAWRPVAVEREVDAVGPYLARGRALGALHREEVRREAHEGRLVEPPREAAPRRGLAHGERREVGLDEPLRVSADDGLDRTRADRVERARVVHLVEQVLQDRRVVLGEAHVRVLTDRPPGEVARGRDEQVRAVVRRVRVDRPVVRELLAVARDALAVRAPGHAERAHGRRVLLRRVRHGGGGGGGEACGTTHRSEIAASRGRAALLHPL